MLWPHKKERAKNSQHQVTRLISKQCAAHPLDLTLQPDKQRHAGNGTMSSVLQPCRSHFHPCPWDLSHATWSAQSDINLTARWPQKPNQISALTISWSLHLRHSEIITMTTWPGKRGVSVGDVWLMFARCYLTTEHAAKVQAGAVSGWSGVWALLGIFYSG